MISFFDDEALARLDGHPLPVVVAAQRALGFSAARLCDRSTWTFDTLARSASGDAVPPLLFDETDGPGVPSRIRVNPDAVQFCALGHLHVGAAAQAGDEYAAWGNILAVASIALDAAIVARHGRNVPLVDINDRGSPGRIATRRLTDMALLALRDYADERRLRESLAPGDPVEGHATPT